MSKKRSSPAVTKSDIVEYFNGVDGYRGSDGRYPLAWNVKVYHVDLELDNLLRIFNEHDGPSCMWEHDFFDTSCDQFMAFLRDMHDECGQERLCESAMSDARHDVLETDAYRMLDDCEESFKVDFDFVGRSGGHVVVSRFKSHSLN